MTECPKCGSELYDNSAKVADGWKGPTLKCKNSDCDYRKWPPKGAKAAPARGAKWTWVRLWGDYVRCVRLAEKAVSESAKRMQITYSMADVASVAATLFIAADRGGMQEATPAAKREPLDERPAALATAADDDDLPF